MPPDLPAAPLPPWKSELDAIIGARHGGAGATLIQRLRELDQRYPNVAEINFQLAWTCEILDRTREAVAYYEKALTLGLTPNDHAAALLGLGASLRTIGESARAVETLRTARTLFPDNHEFGVFLALALHDTKQHAEAMQLLLHLLTETSDDPGIVAHQRAIRFHAAQLSGHPGAA
jgi:tetratricopeptide (TPR) repeat protein